MNREHHAEMARRHAEALVKYPTSQLHNKEWLYHTNKVTEHDAKRTQESRDDCPSNDAPRQPD